jgi:hypothetical protein
MVVLKGEVDLGVETRLPVRAVTLGRLGPSLGRQRMSPHRPVVGVNLVEGLVTNRPPLLTKVAGGGTGLYPEEVPAQTSPLPLPPFVGSWS